MFEALKYNLKNNRRGVMKQATAWFLFSAIIVVFIFWGMTPRNQSLGAGGPAAIVNDAAISPVSLQEAMERLKRDPRMEQLQQLGPDAGRQIFQQQALSQLIEMELIRQATDHDRIWTPDAEVRDLITGIPQFQEDGKFKRERYMGYLAAVRKTPAEFEADIRNEQALRRTVRLFTAALHPSQLEVAKQKAISDLKADLDYVSIPVNDVVQPESVSETDIETYLKKSENDGMVKEYYNSHKADFSKEEQVKARHILVMAKKDDPESEKKALAKIDELARRAKTEDFAKLASESSEDPGSKEKGGLLDFFSRGRMVKPFEDVAFSLPVNSVSAPVKTDYGYHLIKVLEKRPAATRTLEDTRTEIASILIARERSRVALDQLTAALKKGDLSEVNKFVADHKLKWESTGPFAVNSESIPKLGVNDELARIAFSLSPDKPLAENLIHQGPKAYIAKYKAVEKDAQANQKTAKTGKRPKSDADVPAIPTESRDEMNQEMMASRGSEDVLRQWVDGLRKEARISTNGTVFSSAE